MSKSKTASKSETTDQPETEHNCPTCGTSCPWAGCGTEEWRQVQRITDRLYFVYTECVDDLDRITTLTEGERQGLYTQLDIECRFISSLAARLLTAKPEAA